MSLELFVILVITGFALGVNLVVTIARSLNPFARYPGQPEYYSPGYSSMGGWGTVLVLLSLGYFLFQSKCGRNIRDWMSETKPATETPEQKPDKKQVKIFDALAPNEQGSGKEAPSVPQPLEQIGREIYDPNYMPAGESRSNEVPVLSNTALVPEGTSAYFYLQVSASRIPSAAKSQQQKWAEKTGYKVLIGTVSGESPIWYRIVIGPFDSQGEAETYRDEHNIEGFVQSSDVLAIIL